MTLKVRLDFLVFFDFENDFKNDRTFILIRKKIML